MRAMAQRSWNTGEPLELIELPTPEPRADEVRVSVQSIGLNPADCQMLIAPPMRLLARALGPKPPVVLGLDFAGTVDAVGPQVRDFRPGDRVVGSTDFSRGQRGCFAEAAVVRADQVCHVPDAVDLDTAVALAIPGVTAHRTVVDIGHIRRVEPSQRRVLVLGASGAVGQLTVQIAKHEGAVVVGVCSTKNVELVKELGADIVLDYTRGDVLEQARQYGPFQIVADCADAYSRRKCLSLLSAQGRYVMVSMHNVADAVYTLIPPFQARTILGRPTRDRLAPLMAAADAGQLTVNIAQHLPLTSLQEAVDLSESHRMTGKLILHP